MTSMELSALANAVIMLAFANATPGLDDVTADPAVEARVPLATWKDLEDGVRVTQVARDGAAGLLELRPVETGWLVAAHRPVPGGPFAGGDATGRVLARWEVVGELRAVAGEVGREVRAEVEAAAAAGALVA